MKSLVAFISILIMSVYISKAQSLPTQNFSNVDGIGHASPISITPCAGGAIPQSIDLKWKPILNKKLIEIDHEAPNQDYIDSIKAYKMKLKDEYESKHGKSGARTTTVAPIVGTNFSGYAANGSDPLDNSIAISNGGIIVSVENTIISYANTSGTLLGGYTMYSMLSPYYTLYNVCDPVILYDPNYDRFIFFCQEINSAGLFHNNRIFVCFSKTNDPSTGGWWYYSFTGDPTGTGDAFDYPKLAINDSELFITGNLFTIGTTNIFHQAVIYQFDKLAGYSGSSVSGVNYTGILGSPSTILPVSWGQNGDITTGMLLVSTKSFGDNTINYYRIYGNWCCHPTYTYNSIPTTPYSPAGDSYQLGTTTKLNTNDCRALSGFYLNGILHFVFHSDYGSGFCGINYNRFDLTTLTNTSSLAGALGYDFAYPSVASYATATTTDKSVMIGFGLSGSTIYPKIGVINCDDAMTWSTYTTVHSSSNYIQYGVGDTLDRWGDYTGMSRHHSSTTPSVWMSGMFSYTNKWQTWIAEIHDAGTTTTCAVPTGLSVSTITSMSVVLNWAAASGAVSYNIIYMPVGGTSWTTVTSTTTSYLLSGLTPSTNYIFEVQTVCAGTGSSSYSSSDNFTTSGSSTTSINQPNNSSGSSVYPNPITNTFTVEFSLEQDCRLNISVIDVNGKIVKELYNGNATIGDNVFSFDKSNLTSGVYFLTIRSNTNVIKNQKIVIE